MVHSAHIPGWGIENSTIGLILVDRLTQGIIAFKDEALCAVFTIFFLVLSVDNGEGIHDVSDINSTYTVQVKEHCIKLAPN
jgi:hypothetical protein